MNRPPLQAVSVLVVDDDPRVRALYAMVLLEAGAKVTTSGTAAEAVQLADLHPPDIAVTDLRMPAHDGVWFLREVKARMPAIPVIAVSGDPDAPGRDDLLRVGFAEILYKPVGLSQLVMTVARVLHVPSERRGRQAG
jgi:DNA-binding NtrC family response regulator